MTHIIIPNINPVKFYGIRFLLLLLVMFLLWGSFELGYKQSLETTSAALREKAIVEQQTSSTQAQAQAQNNDTCETSKEFILLEQKFLIAEEACQIVKNNIDNDKQKIMELEKELSFYKAIVAPAKDKDKDIVYLQSFKIVPYAANKKVSAETDNDEAGYNNESLSKGKLFQYKFIVAQKVKKRTQTKGMVTIYIKGKKDNKEVKLSMVSLLYTKGQTDEKKIKSFKLGFKYFQEFSGIIQLPVNMQPQSVDIMMKIKTNNKNIKPKIELNDLIWSDEGKVKYVEQ